MMIYKSNLKIQEGKAQAIQILKKGLDSYEVSDKWIKILINAIEDLDPTKPKNKYLELFSKFFIKHFDGDYLIHLARAEEDDMDTSLINKVIVKSMTSFNSQLQDDKIPDKINSIEKRNLPINLSKIKDYKDFVKQLDSISSTLTKSSKKRGIQGLKLGKDYLQIPTPNKLDTTTMILVPLNYKASKIIASDYVGHCEGKWCTAYQKTDEYWESYIEENEGVLVYIIRGMSDFIPANELKMAIYFYNDFKASEGFDANDKAVQPRSIIYYKEIEIYVKSNYDKIQELIAFDINNKSPEEKLVKNLKQYQPDMEELEEILKSGAMSPNNFLIKFYESLDKHEASYNAKILMILLRYGKKELDFKLVDNNKFLTNFCGLNMHGNTYATKCHFLKILLQELDDNGLKLDIDKSKSFEISEAFLRRDVTAYQDNKEQLFNLLKYFGVETETYTKSVLPDILGSLLYNLIFYEYDNFNETLKYIKMATWEQLIKVNIVKNNFFDLRESLFEKQYFNFDKWEKLAEIIIKKNSDKEYVNKLILVWLSSIDQTHFPNLDILEYLVNHKNSDINKIVINSYGYSCIEKYIDTKRFYFSIYQTHIWDRMDKLFGIEENNIHESVYKSKFKGKL